MILQDLADLAVPVGDLKLLPGNPRIGDIPAVKRSLARFGQRKPIVARESDRVVIAGNHTLLAAQSLGWPEVAVVWVDDDTATSLAFALADNRTSELGSTDGPSLAAMAATVKGADPELLAAASWTEADLLALLALADPPDLSDFNGPDDPGGRGPQTVTCPECGAEFTP